jgi:hypothetical protein
VVQQEQGWPEETKRKPKKRTSRLAKMQLFEKRIWKKNKGGKRCV